MKTEIRNNAANAAHEIVKNALPMLVPVLVAKKEGYALDTGFTDDNGKVIYAVIDVTIKATEDTKTGEEIKAIVDAYTKYNYETAEEMLLAESPVAPLFFEMTSFMAYKALSKYTVDYRGYTNFVEAKLKGYLEINEKKAEAELAEEEAAKAAKK